MGGQASSRMTSHQQKKLDTEGMLAFRERFDCHCATRPSRIRSTGPGGRREIEYLRARRARTRWWRALATPSSSGCRCRT